MLAVWKGGEVGVGSWATEPLEEAASLTGGSSFMRIRMSYILGAALRDKDCNSANLSASNSSGSM